MIVHTMTVPQMVAEARKDFPALYNKLDKPLRQARREHIRTKEDFLHLQPWHAPKGNNWLLLIHQSSRPRVYTMAWYHDKDGRINALWTTRSGMAFHIDRHVIERYGERFDPTADPLERLQSFFLENHLYTLEPTRRTGDDQWSVNIGMNHGMGLGTWDQANELVYISTFVNHGQLFEGQAQAMERMDFERLLLGMSRGQRQHFVAFYKRTYPQDANTPGMAWLEGFAA